MAQKPDGFAEAIKRLRAAKRLVVFTGAGISAESGIPTFRDNGGLWQTFPPEKFASWKGLLRIAALNPRQLAEFLIAVLEPVAIARPNAAHQAIAQLEKYVSTTVITQNVDGLHQEAGSIRVREVHGSFFKIVTLRGRFLHRLVRDDLRRIVERLQRTRSGLFKLPRLGLALRPMIGLSFAAIKRPKIVLFGDALAEPDWTHSQTDMDSCDVVLVVGTSGLIYPAAWLPQRARQRGATVITIDPSEPGDSDIWLRGQAGELVPPLVRGAFECSGEG